MAAWESLLDGLTSAVLTTFGRQVSYWRPDGEPFDVTAILESGSEAESSPLGNNAAAVVRLSDFDPAPD